MIPQKQSDYNKYLLHVYYIKADLSPEEKPEDDEVNPATPGYFMPFTPVDPCAEFELIDN